MSPRRRVLPSGRVLEGRLAMHFHQRDEDDDVDAQDAPDAFDAGDPSFAIDVYSGGMYDGRDRGGERR